MSAHASNTPAAAPFRSHVLPDPDTVAELRQQIRHLKEQHTDLSKQLYHFKTLSSTDEQAIVDRIQLGDYHAMACCRTLESKRELLRMATLTSDPDVTIAVCLFLKTTLIDTLFVDTLRREEEALNCYLAYLYRLAQDGLVASKAAGGTRSLHALTELQTVYVTPLALGYQPRQHCRFPYLYQCGGGW